MNDTKTNFRRSIEVKIDSQRKEEENAYGSIYKQDRLVSSKHEKSRSSEREHSRSQMFPSIQDKSRFKTTSVNTNMQTKR